MQTKQDYYFKAYSTYYGVPEGVNLGAEHDNFGTVQYLLWNI